MQQGARYAEAAAIDRAVDEAVKLLNEKPQLLLSGGAVEPVRKLISTPHRVVPDLVLKGLAVMI